ncbi:MAG: BTAD domain-containing putative transcriptional regulator [Potamolinea sp.]
MPPKLQISLLGDFSLRSENEPVTGFNTERAQALLAYLVLNSHAPQPRQRIAFYFWGDSTDSQARTNLRRELHYLRRTLPDADQFLLVDAKTLQWQLNTECTLDVREFEEAAKAAEKSSNQESIQSTLERAAELYRGDLLPNCDDDWIVPQRERLRQTGIRVLEQLIQLLEAQCNYRCALKYAQQLLRIEPLSESTYCHVMRLHELSGDRATALRVYHQCMTLLQEELGIDPSPATKQLYERLLREEEDLPKQLQAIKPKSVNTSPSLPVTPLIGRDQEWKTIQHWLTAISNTASSNILLIIGEPGIGKTCLLESLRYQVQNINGQVLWGRGFGAEMVRPYGAWIDALRAQIVHPTNLPTDLGLLLPELGNSSTAPADRSRLFDAVVQFLTQLCNHSKPVCIVLDDIQWLDEASSALLHYATRLLSHLPIFFACAARVQELEENTSVLRLLQSLKRERRLQKIELIPLPRQQTAELIRTVCTKSESHLDWENWTERVFIESGGNPLFALEVARVLCESEASQSDTLESLIQDRLQQLDSEARELLAWAAALGRSFQPNTVAHVAEYPLSKLLTAFEQLERHNIIRPGVSVNYDFAHDIVRQVAYRQISAPRCRLMHLQIAQKLNERCDADESLLGDIAHHATQGGDYRLAVKAALAAAERSLKLFAYAEAAELIQRGIEHCQYLNERERVAMHIKLLSIYIGTGLKNSQLMQLENELHYLIDRAHALRLLEEEAVGLEAILRVNFERGDFTKVHKQSLSVVETARTTFSPASTAQMLAYSGSCLAEIGREMQRGEALLLEAQSLATRLGIEIGDIRQGLGCVRRHNGDYEEARQLLSQGLQLLHIQQDHWRECYTLMYLAMVELEDNRPTVAIGYCNQLASLAAQMGEGSGGPFAAALQALAQYTLGQENSTTNLEEALLTLVQIDAKKMLAYVQTSAAEVDLKQQRPQKALKRAELALTTTRLLANPNEIALAWATLIKAQLAVGDKQTALSSFQDLQEILDESVLSQKTREVVGELNKSLPNEY